MKAPNITKGNWTWVFVPSFGQWMLISDDLTPVGIGGSPSAADTPDKKITAAAPMLGESLAELVSLERERARLFGHELFPSTLRAIDALKAAGYEE